MASRVIVKSNLSLVAPLVREAAAAVLVASAMEMDGEIKQSFAGPKTGREYKRGGRVHQAAGAGEAPAIDTGHLASSNGVDASEAKTALKVTVFNTAEYAEALEEGTARIAPRPFMTPAAEKQRARLPKRLGAAVEAATKRAEV